MSTTTGSGARTGLVARAYSSPAGTHLDVVNGRELFAVVVPSWPDRVRAGAETRCFRSLARIRIELAPGSVRCTAFGRGRLFSVSRQVSTGAALALATSGAVAEVVLMPGGSEVAGD